MALIDKASLLMVPSTYEDGTLYNVLPSGNKAPDETGNHNGYDQTRADFTFSRGSNLAATRVNSDGLIEKGRENLILYSNDFSQSNWSKLTNTTYTLTTETILDPFGVSKSIYKVTLTGTGYITLRQSFMGDTRYMTASVYVKLGSSNYNVTLDQSDGDSQTAEANTDWQRLSSTHASGYSFSFMDIALTGDAGDYFYVSSAQMELGGVSTTYLETGATTATAGVLENTPRIDYSSGAGALLLEPQRTNRLFNSEYFGDWQISGNITITTNGTTSPEGLQNASIIDFSSATSASNGVYVFAGSPSSAPSRTIYLKGAVGGETLDFSDPNQGGGSNITLTTEWQRFEFTGGNAALCGIWLKNSVGNIIHAYGAQVEEGTYPSSYVPTYGSAATRGADSCSVTGVSDVIGQTEGTLFLDYETDNAEDNGRLIAIGDGSTSNRILLRNQGSGTLLYVAAGGSSTWSTTYYTPGNTGRIKIALAYANNDGILFVNGSSVNSDTSVTIPTCSNVYIGTSEYGGSESVNMLVHDATLFNERLTNEELATLTTL